MQPINYPLDPQDYVGKILRLRDLAYHKGWMITDIIPEYKYGSLGWNVVLTSAETGIFSHTESWGFIGMLIKTKEMIASKGEEGVASPIQAASSY